MRTLTIIGCGSLARSLARLWSENEIFAIGDILNRSIDSAKEAVAQIGGGSAVSLMSDIRQADLYLIATPDSQIKGCADELEQSGLIDSNSIVFHCSGVLSSEVLSSVKKRGASIASAHPLRSFAKPILSKVEFAGTYCSLEGEDRAVKTVSQAFEALDAITIAIEAKDKVLYHTAGAIVCNYLTSLMELGLQTYEKAGIDRELTLKMIEPFVRGTLDNFFALGPVASLSGPIARGDCETISTHLAALEEWSKPKADLYRLLGSVALELSRAQGTANRKSLEELKVLLNTETS
jgi:predicted short-subunit dehydrogenase-like oxidoreductase (DUF2520 family)